MNQLLVEESYELESEVIEEINESSGQKQKNYYIKGIFSTPERKNKNGRIYPKSLWEQALTKWKEAAKSDPRHYLGENEHPSRVSIDPMKAVLKITKLDLEEGFVKGKAKILNNNSPETNQMKALIDEGIKIGVSSRSTGKMKGSIVEAFDLITFDAVSNPSDYNAMLSGITESTEKPVVLQEGRYVCTDGDCLLEGTDASDIAQSPTNLGCQKRSKELLNKLKEYTDGVQEPSEVEKQAAKLIEVMKRKETPETKETSPLEGAKDRFWKEANNLKKFLKDVDKKAAKQLEHALGEVEDIIQAAGGVK